MSEEPLTARDLCAIIRRWLETDDPTHWGDFEQGLSDLIRAQEGGLMSNETPFALHKPGNG